MRTDLDQYKWKNRILVVFVTAEGSKHWTEQKNLFVKQADGAKSRDLLLLKNHRNKLKKPSNSNEKEPTFVMHLVGKDGSIKKVYTKPQSLNKVFDVIDAMPMRQQEMKKN